MLRIPAEEGVEIYGAAYAKALAKTVLGEANLMFVPMDKIEAMIDALYEAGYMLAQAHDDQAMRILKEAFSQNRSMAIDKPEMFGELRWLKPSDALQLVSQKAGEVGLPVAFMAPQLESLVGSLYVKGICLSHCPQEPEKHWFQNEHKKRNPVIRLRPPDKGETKE